MSDKAPLLYTRFERFWHWGQALLIILMLFTGFDLHGSYQVLDFHTALNLHIAAAVALMVLWVFAIFWHLTTGEWRQYLPTPSMLPAVMRYYAVGIFKGEQHPHRRTRQRKLNPLQALSYLSFKLFLAPLVWISGVLLLLRALWPEWVAGLIPLEVLASIHVATAFALLAFLIVHVYMTTTGSTVTHHIRSMITGRDEELV